MLENNFEKPIDPASVAIEILRAACQKNFPQLFTPSVIDQANKVIIDAENEVEVVNDPYTEYFHKMLRAFDLLGITSKGRVVPGQESIYLQLIGLPGDFKVLPPIIPYGTIQIHQSCRVNKRLFSIIPYSEQNFGVVRLSAAGNRVSYRDHTRQNSEWSENWEEAKKILDPFYESVMHPSHQPEELLKLSQRLKTDFINNDRRTISALRKITPWKFIYDEGTETLVFLNPTNIHRTEELRVSDEGGIFYRQICHRDTTHKRNEIRDQRVLAPNQRLNPHGAFLKFQEVYRSFLG